MREIKIYIEEEDTGRVALNIDWGDWNSDSSTYKEKLMAVSLHEPMREMLKNLPVGTLIAHAEADSREEAKEVAGLMADVAEAEMKEEKDEQC